MGGSSIAGKEAIIPKLMGEVDGVISRLIEEASVLSKRLEPVLSASPPPLRPKETGPTAGSSLSLWLATQSERLSALVSVMDDMIGRIEL